jgi:RimJ/RimL family protein N-acetyltransferase
VKIPTQTYFCFNFINVVLIQKSEAVERFPILFSPRLKFRKLEIEDLPSLVKYANNRKISDWIINIPYPYQEPNAAFRMSYVVQGFKTKSRYVFAIILRETDEMIGEISLHLNGQNAELGYWIGEPFWNKGLISEAVKEVIDFGFKDLDLQLIHATCHVENPASGRVLMKNGFQQHGLKGNIIQYILQAS